MCSLRHYGFQWALYSLMWSKLIEWTEFFFKAFWICTPSVIVACTSSLLSDELCHANDCNILFFLKNLQTGGQEKRCCWVCVPCDKHQILKNESHCEDCDLGYYPNKLHTSEYQLSSTNQPKQWIKKSIKFQHVFKYQSNMFNGVTQKL